MCGDLSLSSAFVAPELPALTEGEPVRGDSASLWAPASGGAVLLLRSPPNANCAVETRAVRDTVTISAAAQRIECHMHVRAGPPPGKDDAFEPAAPVTLFVPPWMSAVKECSPTWTS